MWQNTDLIGYSASALASISLVPQVYKVIKTKRADDLSYGMITIIMLASILWQTHGWLHEDIPLRVASGITICVNCTLAWLKGVYGKVV